MVKRGDGLRRVRLSEWAREQGISRITAYRMLRRNILPVPTERSPTGRWYVLMPYETAGNTALYARCAPGVNQIKVINQQVDNLTRWAAKHNRHVHTIVREIADPLVSPLPRLERLLSDKGIAEIVVESPRIIGASQFGLLLAALAPQGRLILTIH